MSGKERSEALALLGGRPRFEEVLHVGRPNLGDRGAFIARVEKILDDRWLTNDGPLVRDLEAELIRRTGAQNCVAMSNGTIALEIAIRAMDLAGEVILPAFTFVATAHALQWQEITPVFCDVDPVTHALDPAKIDRMITPRTSGIIGVHLWGNICDVNEIEAVADRHGLPVLYDAAHAFACSRAGVAVGNNGRAEVLSFHATKFLNSFEGGAVLTNDDELAERMRLMRNFGFAGYDNVIYVGTNGKMTEVAAAMALTNLDASESFIEWNRRNYATYQEGLVGIDGFQMFRPSEQQDCWNHQYVVLEVDPATAALTRDELLQVLWAENVHARRYFAPGVHRMEPYRSYFPHAGLLLANTERLADQVLVLPTGTAVSEEDAQTICAILREAIWHAGTVRDACTHLHRAT